MKMTEIRELSEKDLKDKLTSLRQDLFNLRLRHATAQLEKTASIPATKKDIARVLTVMSEKGIKA